MRTRETAWWLIAAIPTAMAETCLSQSQFAGVIFGSVAATLVICTTVAVVFWLCLKNSNKRGIYLGADPQTAEKSAFTNPSCNAEDGGCNVPPKISQKDQVTMIDSFKVKRKLLDTGTQKSFSVENINEVDCKVGVLLNSENIAGFGMNIQGNMNEGIFVKDVLPKGAAEQTGNILAGDRIKSLTINFENMVYEDALTLLSYASPYKVKFELERRIETPRPKEGDPDSTARTHPLFRSNTLTHIHFNPIGCELNRRTSENFSQNNDLISPKAVIEKKEDTSEETVEKVEMRVSETCNIPDSTSEREVVNVAFVIVTATDFSKMESSDYASDNTSADYRESESDGGAGSESVISAEGPSQTTICDRIEITDIIVDKQLISSTSAPTKIEYCKELPPKQKNTVSRSPSPKMIYKPPTATLPVPQTVQAPKTEKGEKIEYTIVAASGIPLKKTPKSRIPPPSPPRAPDFTEARVSRIPKRTESIKTPIIERKLPLLPRSVTQRSHSAEDKVVLPPRRTSQFRVTGSANPAQAKQAVLNEISSMAAEKQAPIFRGSSRRGNEKKSRTETQTRSSVTQQQKTVTQPQIPTKSQPVVPPKPTVQQTSQQKSVTQTLQKPGMKTQPDPVPLQEINNQPSKIPQRIPGKVQSHMPEPKEFKTAPAEPLAKNTALKQTAKIQEEQLAQEQSRIVGGIHAQKPAMRQENVQSKFIEKEEAPPEKQAVKRAGLLAGAQRWEEDSVVRESESMASLRQDQPPSAVRLQDDACWQTQHRQPAEVQPPQIGRITIPEISDIHEVHRTVIVNQPQQYQKVKWNEFPEELKPEIGSAPKVHTQEWIPVNQENIEVQRSLYKPSKIGRTWPPPEEEIVKDVQPVHAVKASDDCAWIQQEQNEVLRSAAWSSNSKINRVWPPPEGELLGSQYQGPQHMPAVQWPPLESEQHEREQVEVLQKHIPAKKMDRQWPPPPPQYQGIYKFCMMLLVIESSESNEPAQQSTITTTTTTRVVQQPVNSMKIGHLLIE
uniref:PDZ domain-containing protein n=1 Tax=Heterorhabditis bacteriophora TaxID=37862 RepID=A0A1I7XN25_HETBA